MFFHCFSLLTVFILNVLYTLCFLYSSTGMQTLRVFIGFVSSCVFQAWSRAIQKAGEEKRSHRFLTRKQPSGKSEWRVCDCREHWSAHCPSLFLCNGHCPHSGHPGFSQELQHLLQPECAGHVPARLSLWTSEKVLSSFLPLLSPSTPFSFYSD